MAEEEEADQRRSMSLLQESEETPEETRAWKNLPGLLLELGQEAAALHDEFIEETKAVEKAHATRVEKQTVDLKKQEPKKEKSPKARKPVVRPEGEVSPNSRVEAKVEEEEPVRVASETESSEEQSVGPVVPNTDTDRSQRLQVLWLLEGAQLKMKELVLLAARAHRKETDGDVDPEIAPTVGVPGASMTEDDGERKVAFDRVPVQLIGECIFTMVESLSGEIQRRDEMIKVLTRPSVEDKAVDVKLEPSVKEVADESVVKEAEELRIALTKMEMDFELVSNRSVELETTVGKLNRELHEVHEAKDAEIAALLDRSGELETRMTTLEQALERAQSALNEKYKGKEDHGFQTDAPEASAAETQTDPVESLDPDREKVVVVVEKETLIDDSGKLEAERKLVDKSRQCDDLVAESSKLLTAIAKMKNEIDLGKIREDKKDRELDEQRAAIDELYLKQVTRVTQEHESAARREEDLRAELKRKRELLAAADEKAKKVEKLAKKDGIEVLKLRNRMEFVRNQIMLLVGKFHERNNENEILSGAVLDQNVLVRDLMKQLEVLVPELENTEANRDSLQARHNFCRRELQSMEKNFNRVLEATSQRKTNYVLMGGRSGFGSRSSSNIFGPGNSSTIFNEDDDFQPTPSTTFHQTQSTMLTTSNSASLPRLATSHSKSRMSSTSSGFHHNRSMHQTQSTHAGTEGHNRSTLSSNSGFSFIDPRPQTVSYTKYNAPYDTKKKFPSYVGKRPFVNSEPLRGANMYTPTD